MKICRFGKNRLGLVEGETVVDVTQALSVLRPCSYPLDGADQLVANLPRIVERIKEIASGGTRYAVDELRMLSPVANPGKVVAAPVNYRKHLEEARADAEIHHHNAIQEITRIGLFLKATSSIVGPGEGVVIKHPARRNDHEVELVAIIGEKGSDISESEALDYVAAYCIGLDMTTRGPEERSLRKSIDTYCVLGPWMVTADEIGNPHDLDLALSVNGELRQKANTRDLILDVSKIIAFASSFYTLHPGDIVFTGTPEGVGPVQAGDTMSCHISRIGGMTVEVTGSRSRS